MTQASNQSGSRHDAALRFLSQHVEAGHFPSAVFAFGPPADTPRWGGACSANEATLFDLASLTKGIFTALVAARLAARGQVSLDEPLDELLPEMRAADAAVPSLRRLLAHDAGLPAWAPLYRLAANPAVLPRCIAALPRDCREGVGPLYSCLGPLLAGIALERSSGRSLRQLLVEEVVVPLAIPPGELLFSPLPSTARDGVAPTECGRQREAELATSWFSPAEPVAAEGRGHEIVPGPAAFLCGEVHDGNACFLGGAAGNAGLFGTARAVFRVASALLVDDDFLPYRWRRLFAEPCARGEGDVRSFGFQSGEAPEAPVGAFGAASFGHVGFTGTSLWIGVPEGPIAVLLTNRVHPRYVAAPMQDWRRAFHDLLLEAS